MMVVANGLRFEPISNLDCGFGFMGQSLTKQAELAKLLFKQLQLLLKLHSEGKTNQNHLNPT